MVKLEIMQMDIRQEAFVVQNILTRRRKEQI
jgi:hypothetical protein